MIHKKKQTITAFIMTAAALVLSGCSSQSEEPEQPQEYVSTRGHVNRWGRSVDRYTKDDYDFLLSFRTEGYDKEPVEEFNRKVLDWKDEDAYHQTEDIFIRVFQFLSEDDENADFILNTLGNTWNECEKRHFNTCEREKAPWHNGNVKYETYGDVFGDSVLLTGGYADFSFDYHLAEDQKLTVGQRDELLNSIGTGLETYMKEQPVNALKNEETMKKSLSAQLEKILKSMKGGVAWGGNSDMDYYWEEPYEPVLDTSIAAESFAEEESAYTRKQYDLVMKKLKPENYEQMSVSEFNRTISRAFSEDEGDEDGVTYAYEMVMSTLPEKDENWTYLHETVQRALNEYQTRTIEVYTGKNTDFRCTEDISVPLMEDVYGDQMVVGSIEGAYEFTYRITNADKLTIKDREKFIESVKQKTKESVEKEAKKGTVGKADLKKLLESAGKNAGSKYIEFTGCSVEYLEAYR